VTALLTILHVIICLVLIAAVLLQSGKAADLAGAFGGAGSATAFGPRGTQSLMAKITTACAVLFMVTSISLWLFTTPERKSRMGTEQGKPAAAQTQNQQGSGPAPSTTPEKQAGSGTAASPAGTATTGQPSATQPQPPASKPPEPAKKQL